MTENNTGIHSHTEGELRIGVYICHCGTNIAGVVDVAQVAEWTATNLKHRSVVMARDYKFMCSSLGQGLIEKDAPLLLASLAMGGPHHLQFPLQRVKKCLSFVKTDADIAGNSGIAAATDFENPMRTGLYTSIGKLHGH